MCFKCLQIKLHFIFCLISGMCCWYENQFGIKGDLVFGVYILGSVPIWDAKTGKLLCHVDSFTGPEKSISVSGNYIIISSPMEVAIYNECNEQGLVLVAEKDVTSLGLQYLSCANSHDVLESDYDIQFIHRNLVGVKMAQNVLVICYIINDIHRECCTIKLAFVPMRDSKGKITSIYFLMFLDKIHLMSGFNK